ncbi:MAG: hemerythrin domain-containing protein [Deltaproteobacteria bacterium]|nr:hemerythrin domain-containing protein [Deltaproteobacteria bacterium]
MGSANQVDPLTRQPEAGVSAAGLSPMDPPEAYAPPALDRVPLEELHPFLRHLSEDHSRLAEELARIDEVILACGRAGFTPGVAGGVAAYEVANEVDRELARFIGFVEHEFIPHSRHEEQALFPLLRKRLIAAGEHGKGREPKTSVDVMQDDHVKAIQLAAVVLNFLRLAPHLPDDRSRLILRDAALRHAKSLVEHLRLHMFREDSIVFVSAHRLISGVELDGVWCKTEARDMSRRVSEQGSEQGSGT